MHVFAGGIASFHYYFVGDHLTPNFYKVKFVSEYDFYLQEMGISTTYNTAYDQLYSNVYLKKIIEPNRGNEDGRLPTGCRGR